MSPDEFSGPDLAGVVADAKAVGLDYVVIGGFSVIYHGHVRSISRPRLSLGALPHEQVLSRRFVLVPALELDFELSMPAGTRLSDALRLRRPW
jgi:hypothetical protein